MFDECTRPDVRRIVVLVACLVTLSPIVGGATGAVTNSPPNASADGERIPSTEADVDPAVNTESDAMVSQSAAESDPPSPSISLGNATGDPNASVSVYLRVNSSNVAGYQANVSFDPDVVQFERADGIALATPVVRVDDESGYVRLAQAAATGVDDPILARLTFSIVAAGPANTSLRFVRNDTGLNNETASVPIETYLDGEIRVRPSCPVRGDMNLDGEVTSLDATLVLRSIGGLPTGDQFRETCADVDDDGRVTSEDATLILGLIVEPEPEAPTGPTEIDSCTTITEPGTYELSGNVRALPPGDPDGFFERTCIVVASSDVVLQGNGHAVIGTDPVSGNRTYGIGVAVVNVTDASDRETATISNVSVTNLTVVSYSDGMRLYNVTDATVSNVTVRDSFYGFSTNRATNLSVVESLIENTSMGVLVRASSDVRLLSNGVTDPLDDRPEGYAGGIRLETSDNVTVASNYVIGVDSDGIVASATNGTNVTGNVVGNTREVGFRFAYTRDASIRNNLAYRANNSGFVFSNMQSGTVADNRAFSSGSVGISIEEYADQGGNENMTYRDLIAQNSSFKAFEAVASFGPPTPVTVTNLSFDGSTVSARGQNFVFEPAGSVEGAVAGPINLTAARPNESWVLLNVSYTDRAVEEAGANESALRLYVNDTYVAPFGVDDPSEVPDGWRPVEGLNGVDTEQNYVFANLTELRFPYEWNASNASANSTALDPPDGTADARSTRAGGAKARTPTRRASPPP